MVVTIWDEVFKNAPSKIGGRQPFKIWRGMDCFSWPHPLDIFERLCSTSFTWSIFEYFHSFIAPCPIQFNKFSVWYTFARFQAKKKTTKFEKREIYLLHWTRLTRLISLTWNAFHFICQMKNLKFIKSSLVKLLCFPY